MRGDKSLKLHLTPQETPTAMDDLSSTAVRCVTSHKGCRAKGTMAVRIQRLRACLCPLHGSVRTLMTCVLPSMS